jgi:hypothetical protein
MRLCLLARQLGLAHDADYSIYDHSASGSVIIDDDVTVQSVLGSWDVKDLESGAHRLLWRLRVLVRGSGARRRRRRQWRARPTGCPCAWPCDAHAWV